MKKFYLLLILMLPIIVNAETYYTDYELYLKDQTEKIEVNDLIKEEEINYYHHNLEVRINEDYYPIGNNPINAPYMDINDKLIISKRENYYLQPGASKGVLYPVEDNTLVNFFEIIDLSYIPKIQLYDINYNPIKHSIVNQQILFEESMSIADLIIIFEFNQSMNFNIVFDHQFEFNVAFVEKTIKNYELNFAEKSVYTKRLNSIGVYTMAIFPAFDYYVYYTYNYKYYDLVVKENINTDPSGKYDLITTKYNYYKRDKIIFKDYLILSKENQDILSYIVESSFDKNNLSILEEIDYEINGVYEVTYTYKNLNIKKDITILNKVVIEEPQIDIKEPEIITKNIHIKFPKSYLIREQINIFKESDIKKEIITKVKHCYLKNKLKCPIIKELIIKIKEPIEIKKAFKSKDFNATYILPVMPSIMAAFNLKHLKRLSQLK